MVKTTKGGRAMNPADAFRKEQRKKEVARNKLERKYTREAVSNRDKPEEIKKQLQEIIDLEEQGTLNKAQKLRKKVLQDAYDHALKKRKDEDIKNKAGGSGTAVSVPGAMGVIRPEDSRYYHPTLNPTGAPPPGKLAAVVIANPGAAAAQKSSIPLPKPPPLPAGPAPKLPPPPAAPPLPAGALPPTSAPAIPLPPPSGPPPGYPGSALPAPLPPPSVPPPGWRLPPPAAPPPGSRLPPPPGPPPGFQPTAQPQPMDEDSAPGTESQAPAPGAPPALQPPLLPPPPHLMPPPGMPPPGMMMPPPPPQGMYGAPHPQGALPPPSYPPPAASAAAPKANATITGSSTVVKRPLAHLDKSLTSMVPASVLVRREQVKPKKPVAPRAPRSDFGFGLAPIPRSAINSAPDPDAPPMSSAQHSAAAAAARQQEQARSSAGPATQQAAPVSVDAQYQEFLASMKEMGAL